MGISFIMPINPLGRGIMNNISINPAVTESNAKTNIMVLKRIG